MKKNKIFELIFILIGIFTVSSCFDGSEKEHTEHEFSEWYVQSEPDCMNEGYAFRECFCGEREERFDPRTEHNYQEVFRYEGTADEYGYIRYECIYCGDSYEEQSKEKIEHNLVLIEERQPYCDNEGNQYDGFKRWRCNDCGYSYDETIKKEPCTFTIVDRCESTCTDKGYIKYGCTVNNDHCYYEYDESTGEHKYDFEVFELYHIGYCVNCHQGYECDYIQIPNDDGALVIVTGEFHKMTESKVVIEPTCTSTGSSESHCEVCNYSVTELLTPVHNYVNDKCEDCGSLKPSDGFIYKPLGTKEYAIVGYEGDSTDIVLPTYYEGKLVTMIANYAFKNTTINSITIPKTITTYTDYAFYGITGLTKVYFNGTLEDWLKLNFAGTTGFTVYSTPANDGRTVYFLNDNDEYYAIEELTIPATLEVVPNFAFANFNQLTSVTFHDNINVIGDGAFYNCDNLTNIEVKAKKINSGAFAYNKNLKTVNILEGTVELYAGTFMSDENLTNVTLPSTLKTIGDSVFYNCDSLVDINIPEGVKTLGSGVFYGSANLTNVSIPSSLEEYGEFIFYNCSNLNYYDIDGAYYLGNEANNKVILLYVYEYQEYYYTVDSSVRFIERNAFTSEDLLTLTIPDTVLGFSYPIIMNSPNLTSLTTPYVGRTIENYMDDTSSITSLTITSGDFDYATVIGSFANLNEIVIDKDVKNIPNDILGGCPSLTKITVPYLGRSNYSINNLFGGSVPDGITYLNITNTTELDYNLFYYLNENSIEFYLPNNLRSISGSAYYNTYSNIPTTEYNNGCYLGSKENPYLLLFKVNSTDSKIILHEDTKLISKYAYADMEDANYSVYENVIYMGTNSNPYKIAYKVIDQSIKKIRLHVDTEIIADTFEFVQNYDREFEFSSNVKEINANFGIYNKDKLIYAGSIRDWMNISFNSLNSNPMKCFNEFYYLDGSELTLLEELIIPTDKYVINDYQFAGLNVSDIIFHSNITSIGKYAFAYLSGMESFTYNLDLDISEGMFAYSKITEFNINSAITEIGAFAFQYASIEVLSIENPVEKVCEAAFANMNNVTEFYMDKVGLFDVDVFYGTIIDDVIFAYGVNEWLDIEFKNQYSTPVNKQGDIYFNIGNIKTRMSGTLTFAEGVVEIGEYQFMNFHIDHIELPSSIRIIGDYAFRDSLIGNNPSKPNVEFPYGLEYIGQFAFANTYLSELKVPESVQYIGIGIIYNCRVQNIVLPFLGSDIESVDDEDHIAYLFGQAHYNYSGSTAYEDEIQSIEILNGTLGTGAFFSLESMTNCIFPNVSVIPDYTFYNCKAISEINLTDVEIIGRNAFTNCYNYKTIYLPDTIRSIGEDAFNGLNNGNEVYYDGTIEDWCYVNIFNYAGTPLRIDGVMYFKNNGEYVTESKVVVPNDITELSGSLFANNYYLEEVYIPETVTYIGPNLLTCCSNIDKLTVPFTGSSLDNFGDINYFYGSLMGYGYDLNEVEILCMTNIHDHILSPAVNIKKLTLPNTVTSISEYAFPEVQLDEFVFKGTIEDWCNIRISNEHSSPTWDGALVYMLDNNNELSLLETIVIPESMNETQYYQFYGFESVKNVYIPENMGSLNGYAFEKCINIENVYYGNTFERWLQFYILKPETNPMYYGSNLYVFENGEYKLVEGDIVIPENITHIGYQLMGITGMESLTLSSDIVQIESFYRLDNLKNVYYPGTADEWAHNVTYRPLYANPYTLYVYNEESVYEPLTSITIDKDVFLRGYDFAGIKSLEYVEFIEGTERISSHMFADSLNLTTVVLADTITEVSDLAFINCPRLEYNEYKNALYLGSATNPYRILIDCIDESVTEFEMHPDCKIAINGALHGAESIEVITSSVPFNHNLWNNNGSSYSMPYNLTEIRYTATDNIYSPVDIISSVKKIVFLESVDSFSQNFTPVIAEGIEEIVFMNEGKMSNFSYFITSTVQYYEYEGGLYLGNDTNPYMVLCYYNDREASNPVIHPDTINIAGGAFSNMYNLVEFTVPSSIKYICNSAFYGCTNLTTVNMTNVEYIDDYAFAGCSSLSTVNFGDKLTELGNYVFQECYGLTKLNLPASLEKIGNGVINLTNITYLVIPKVCVDIYYDANFLLPGISTNVVIYFESDTLPEGNWTSHIYHLGSSWEYVDGIPTVK